MAFHDDLADFTAADLMTAFPGMPRSTAYDWIKGVRWPVAYLQPMALAHVRRSIKKPGNKTQKPMTPARKSKGKGGQ
jgi:hypothetical protein